MSTTTVVVPDVVADTVVPDHVQAGLTRYGLGDKLRQLRHQRRLRLVEVAASSGLSPSLISKLESNKLFPTLPTLWRLADSFHVGLDYFFSEDAAPLTPSLTRSADRELPPSVNGAGFLAMGLLNGPSDPKFHVTMTEVAPSAVVQGQHAGLEFLYVLEGELEISVSQGTYRLGKGDSLYFQSAAPHQYRNPGQLNCKAFVVSSKKPVEGF